MLLIPCSALYILVSSCSSQDNYSYSQKYRQGKQEYMLIWHLQVTILYGIVIIEGEGVISTMMPRHFKITLTTPLSSQLSPSKHETLNQWWYIAGPTLKPVYLLYYRFNVSCLLGRSVCICIIFAQYWPNCVDIQPTVPQHRINNVI